MQITATVELNRALTFAAQVGCYPDQLERFLNAGYVPQAKQMTVHAAARLCDSPTGPDRIGVGGTRGQAKRNHIMMQIICAWCHRILGQKEGEGITHTVCPECKVKLLEELKELPKK